jgi:hypothetical protein
MSWKVYNWPFIAYDEDAGVAYKKETGSAPFDPANEDELLYAVENEYGCHRISFPDGMDLREFLYQADRCGINLDAL